MIKLGTWVTISNISDINLDYLVCAALAASSFMIIFEAGRRLGRSKGFERRILIPLAQESSRVATAILNFGLSQVQDVKATRISCYARSYRYYRTCSSSTREHFRCRPPSSSRFPERRTFLNRRHCALLALIFRAMLVSWRHLQQPLGLARALFQPSLTLTHSLLDLTRNAHVE